METQILQTEDGKVEKTILDNGLNIDALVEPSQKWIDENSQVDLDSYKQSKIDTLKSLCEQTIEAGFTSDNGHHYRTNRDDQINFIGQKDELTNDETITTVMWKTEDVGYIEHTREDWLDIYYEGLAHKKTQLFKYDQLKQLVAAATTKEEVDSIKW